MYCKRFMAGADHLLIGICAPGRTHVALVHPGVKYGSPWETV